MRKLREMRLETASIWKGGNSNLIILTTHYAANTDTVTQIAPTSTVPFSPLGKNKWQNEYKDERRDTPKQ